MCIAALGALAFGEWDTVYVGKGNNEICYDDGVYLGLEE
jgi:hypothetical protein